MLAVVVAMLALVSVFAGACGSSDETTTTAAAATTTSVATETTAAQTTSTEAQTTTTAGLSADLNGAGATFPKPLYVEWIGAFQELNKGVKVNYQGIGSGAGIQQFTKQTVDFGASDAFMKAEEITAAEAARAGAKVIQIPTVFGAIVLAYNLPGSPKLNLDSDTLAKIYLGKITKWNDAAIVALNADAKLPDAEIKTVHRSDSSGTTSGFTSYLTAVSADWKAGPGAGKTVNWPVGIGGQGNDGVAGIVKQNEMSIGYVELAYATQNSMTMAAMKNKSGKVVAPSLDSTSAAADGIQVPADMNVLPLVMDSVNPEAYPIVTGTYVLAYDKMPDAAKAAALKGFLAWALSDEATAIAKDLGYAPLPTGLKDATLKLIDAIGS
jgi:phosphate transport system substrate-binding protein